MEAAYAQIRKEVARVNILGGSTSDQTSQGIGEGLVVSGQMELVQNTEAAGFISRGQPRQSESKFKESSHWPDKSKLRCSHCGQTKHTKDQCFELVGYPEW